MSVLVLAELLNNILPVLYFEPNICSLLDQPSHQSCKHTYLFKTLICCTMAEANPFEKAMLDADIALNITTEPATEDADNNEADDKQSICILWTMTLWRRSHGRKWSKI